MAKINNGMLSGLVGTVVATSWKGIPILKGQNGDVDQPRTPAQKMNWSAFGIISAFCSLHKPMIKIGFQEPLKASYPMNEARSVNAPKHTITGKWPEIILHYDKIKMASGEIPPPKEVSAQIESNKLVICWLPDDQAENAGADDFVNVAVHYTQPELGFKQGLDLFCIAQRKDCMVEIPLENRSLNQFHAWMFYFNPSIDPKPARRKVSDSVYLGMMNDE